ncbi:unnamed protein product [Cuscuta europaea]|uniref:Uncharacterized protein n=1 Tax=Cuscuta europaea TaxID=41803 RepID=A0A9P1E9W6_CUSEU|nr:unnamed protein product [Cuscuta europaea]
MHISQVKSYSSQTISLDVDGVDWLCKSFSLIKSDDSSTFVRNEGYRKIHMSFGKNECGGFICLVDLRHEGRKIIIIPEGEKGDGFTLFCSTILDQPDMLCQISKGNIRITFEDSAANCSSIVENCFEEFASISSLLF